MNTKQMTGLMEPVVAEGKLKKIQVSAWLQEIDSRKTKEKDWRNDAAKIIELYEGYCREASPFNILYSNTDTLAPALYNNTPRPAVGRRFKDTDPLAAAVALTLNRTLSFTMDTNSGAEADFDDLVENSILGALVPGRGVVRWLYDADYTEGGEEAEEAGEQEADAEEVEEIKNTPAEGDSFQTSDNPPRIQQSNTVGLPSVNNERICGVTVAYDRFITGFAKKWSEVPWVAFEHHMTTEELEDNFGSELGSKVKVSELEEDGSAEQKKQKDTRKVAVVYELWNKDDKNVIFLSPGLADRELRIVPDPLKLTGFFPCTAPLTFLKKLSSMVPQILYNIYREQAEELNLCTRRITAVMGALKVRGAYDSTLTELPAILTSDDCVLTAVENIMSLGDGKGLKDAIFLMPLGELVNVLQQLYLQRTQIKQVIYEITGISDILRGGSVASESATAQNIKNQWGTLRLKNMQKNVGKWCKGNLRVIAEIASGKFSQETFQKITGLPYITAQQKQEAEMQMQQFQQQQAMQPQQPGQPPAPPQPPPQQLVDTLATPVWEEIVAMMRSDSMMEYRIDIETNSTIADDMAEDQKNIGELLNALSQFLNGVAPLIENGSMPFEVAKSMMLGIVRKMQMGPEVEDQLSKMTAPKPPEAEAQPAPPPPDPNIALKAQAEQAKIQSEMQKNQQDAQIAQQQGQLALAQADAELKKTEMEVQFAQVEHANKMQLEQEKALVSREKFKQQMTLAQMKVTAAKISSQEVPNANV